MTALKKLRSRLTKLERRFEQRQPQSRYREAILICNFFDGPGHVVVTDYTKGEWGEHYRFETQPGPGPQLEDFGQFDHVLPITYAESRS